MEVIKRSKTNSVESLLSAIEKFNDALATQGDTDAIEELKKASKMLRESRFDSAEFKQALDLIKAAFEEHELEAYTFKPKTEGSWGPNELLYVTSTQVLSLLKRFSD